MVSHDIAYLQYKTKRTLNKIHFTQKRDITCLDLISLMDCCFHETPEVHGCIYHAFIEIKLRALSK